MTFKMAKQKFLSFFLMTFESYINIRIPKTTGFGSGSDYRPGSGSCGSGSATLAGTVVWTVI
jgi:hypothetical protein